MDKKPNSESEFKQQRLFDWQPKLTINGLIVCYLVIGIVFIPVGLFLNDESDQVVELSIKYDGDDTDVSGCKINSANIDSSCEITFDFDKDTTGPLYLYYQVDGFYQNHRRYVKSRSPNQLMGENLGKNDLESDCYPLTTWNGQLLNPCGLIANTFFNDEFTLSNTSDFVMDEDGITWSYDADIKYKQVDGFVYEKVADFSLSCEQVLGFKYDSCENYTDISTGEMYYYWYPHNDNTNFLYERFSSVSPIKGVTDEHFINWMRTSGLKDFRKLYGKIDADVKAGDSLTFVAQLNFDISGYDGSKTLILTTLGSTGSKNVGLGNSYIIVGCVSMAIGLVFALKRLFHPRPMGDIRALGWDSM